MWRKELGYACVHGCPCVYLSICQTTHNTVSHFEQSEGREHGGDGVQRAQKGLNFPFIRPGQKTLSMLFRFYPKDTQVHSLPSTKMNQN